MPDYRRWHHPGATYFFTVTTENRRKILTTPAGRSCLHAAFNETRTRLLFDLWAIVLLPDHLHCIWIMPPDDDDFSTRWSMIKRRFSQRWRAANDTPSVNSPSKTRKRELGVWQRRFWEHLIRNERELNAYRDYIHLNPVKHGLVDDPHDWQWSSVHRHLRLGWLDENWTANAVVDVSIRGDV